jgi:predicted alpha-1,6-mannanase (GH76 family)
LINDSFAKQGSSWSCTNDGSQSVWTYNQGVILGALCDLFTATGDHHLITQARGIADALIHNTVINSNSGPPKFGATDGILTEYSDGDLSCEEAGIDPRQFKGIFVRNLVKLWATSGRPERYRQFILKNAASAISNMNSNNQFGASWSAHVDTTFDFIRQTSAVDLLNAALLVQHQLHADLSYLSPLLTNDRRRAADLSYLDPLLLGGT